MRTLVVTLILLAAGAFAGCVGNPGGEPVDTAGGDAGVTGQAGTEAAADNASDDSAEDTQEGDVPDDPDDPDNTSSSNPGNGRNNSRPETPNAVFVGWADPNTATIRPGIQMTSSAGQCTSNFAFTDDRGNAYLGFAAHCVGALEPGTSIDIGGVTKGTLAYSSWYTMGYQPDASATSGGVCSAETDATICTYNDFAVVKLAASDAIKTSPAMRHFGGPSALYDSSAVQSADKVLSYGNSGVRFETEEAAWHEGYVFQPSNEWSTLIYTATPGIPGDSGSGVLMGDGQALGILVTVTISPYTASNGVTHLDKALEYAREKGGINLSLASWELLNPGLLPGI